MSSRKVPYRGTIATLSPARADGEEVSVVGAGDGEEVSIVGAGEDIGRLTLLHFRTHFEQFSS